MDWLWLLGTVAVIAWIVAVVDMIRHRSEFSRGQFAAWILIVIILPVLGTILYFVLGRKAAVDGVPMKRKPAGGAFRSRYGLLVGFYGSVSSDSQLTAVSPA